MPLLNIGCADCPFWPRRTPDRINVDVAPTGHEDVRADARALPFKAESLDGIYAHHILEHLRRHEAEDVVREWRRALKHGGFLSVVIPDFLLLMTGLDTADEQCGDHIDRDRFIFGHDDAHVSGEHQRHQSMWTLAEVVELMQRAGFVALQAIDPRHYQPLVARPRWQSGVYGVKA